MKIVFDESVVCFTEISTSFILEEYDWALRQEGKIFDGTLKLKISCLKPILIFPIKCNELKFKFENMCDFSKNNFQTIIHALFTLFSLQTKGITLFP